eukprot:8620586-Pyramimonas_sp.AAC.1
MRAPGGALQLKRAEAAGAKKRKGAKGIRILGRGGKDGATEGLQQGHEGRQRGYEGCAQGATTGAIERGPRR